MHLWRTLCFRFRALVGKRRLEADMAEEMRSHLELRVQANLDGGMSVDEARYAAQRQFGGMEQLKEETRHQRGGVWIEQWFKDAKFSLRSLLRARGFSAAVIVTLALCIGANTTVLSVLYGLILKPLPFHDTGQLVEIYGTQSKSGQSKRRVSVAQYLDYKASADAFAGFALWTVWTFNIGEESDPSRGIGARVTPDYFDILGVQPLRGRFYAMEECVPGRDRVIVLTQTCWETRYRSDPDIVGKTIQLGREPHTVIGVAPRSLESLNTDAIMLKPFEWQPAMADPSNRFAQAGLMYARVKAGVPHSVALAQLATLEKRYYEQAAPAGVRTFLDRVGYRMALGGVRAEQTKSVKTSLLLLQGGGLLVLLLGCVNVASLMLARANARHAEFSVRQALGAGRGALARQLLTEALLLATSGAVIGLGLTWVSLRVINTYLAGIVREAPPIALDGTLFGLTLLATMVVAVSIGLLPVVRVWRTNLIASMQGGARGMSGGPGVRAASGVLVTAQVALALVLLVGASLLIRSFTRVLAVDPGFDARRIVYGRIALNASYNEAGAKALLAQLLAKLRAIPGVESVSYSSYNPVNALFTPANFPIRGAAMGAADTFPSAATFGISPEYFETMGIRVIEGRAFNNDDYRSEARRVMIVDRQFAQKYFPGRSALGECFEIGPSDTKPDRWPMIVGVVESVKFQGLDDQSGLPLVYGLIGASGGMSFELRTARPAGAVISAIRAQIRSVDPTLPLYHEGTVQMQIEGMLANRRGVMWLLGAFAAIALLLSAVGIYAMLAYDVTQRTREIGVRGAIGATRGQIVGLILRQGLWKAAAGLAIGLAGAFYFSRFLRSLLFEVESTDPVAYATVAGLILAVALFSSWLPAWRASKVDPMKALRCD